MIVWAWLCMAHSMIVGNVAPVALYGCAWAHILPKKMCARKSTAVCPLWRRNQFFSLLASLSLSFSISFFFSLSLLPSLLRCLCTHIVYRVSAILSSSLEPGAKQKRWRRRKSTKYLKRKTNCAERTDEWNAKHTRKSREREKKITAIYNVVTRVLWWEFHERVFYFERNK